MASQMASLPITTVRAIFAFAASRRTPLRTLAQVSHEWRAYAETIASSKKLQTLKVGYEAVKRADTSRQGLLELRHQMTLRRGWLSQLKVSASVSMSTDPVVSVDLWCSILAQTPLLNTLKVTEDASCYSACLVAAASVQCPRLQNLFVPSEEALEDEWGSREPPSTDDLWFAELVLAAITESLPAWKPLGGLRDVSISLPFHQLTDPHTKAEQFIVAIAANCPKIETIGYDDPCLGAGEEWYIGLPAWEQFCAASTHLQSWMWRPMPFATAFFESFARYPKSQLKILVLGFCYGWNWEQYHSYHPRLVGGFGGTAKNPQAVLEACPALRELYIGVSDDDPSNIDENVFGDAFVEAVAQ
jgi:hypothetical protein